MSKYNKSKTYLFPLLSEVVDIDYKFSNFLINTYIAEDTNQYKDCIFLLYDFSFKNPEFTAYEHMLTDNQYFVDLVDIDDKVLYIFKFPEEYIPEYNNFKKGKYSKYGKDAKEVILSYYTNIYKGNVGAVNFLLKLKQILFKDQILRKKIEKELKVTLPKDAELTDIMDENRETFKIKDIELRITKKSNI